MAAEKAKSTNCTRRAKRKIKNKSELAVRRKLLLELPGSKNNNADFKSMIGHSFTKSNQYKSIKDLSSNLQNVFKLNQNKSGYDFRYYDEKTFNSKASKIDVQLSIFHQNIRSLSKHHVELDTFLNQLNKKFDFICLSECWRSNLTFLGNIFQGYKCKYVPQHLQNVVVWPFFTNKLIRQKL